MNLEATMDWALPCDNEWMEHFPSVALRDCYSGKEVHRVSRSARHSNLRTDGECAKPTGGNPGGITWIIFDKQPAPAAASVRANGVATKAVIERFEILSLRWKEEVGSESSLSKITGNINYLSVIGLGMAAIPLILSDLQKTGAPWFVALEAITGVTGVGAEYPGNFRKKKELWLRWGRDQGYI